MFYAMALAINTIDGRDLVTKHIMSYFQRYVMLYIFAIHFTVKDV